MGIPHTSLLENGVQELELVNAAEGGEVGAVLLALLLCVGERALEVVEELVENDAVG